MTTDRPLTALRDEAQHQVPDPPTLDEVTEDAGRQRLAAYYLYSALMAGLIGDDDLAPARWPPELAEPMQRLGLTRLAPRTGAGLDADLAAAERTMLRNPDRQAEFRRLLTDLINQGAFGPLCGNADRVRLADSGEPGPRDLELIRSGHVVGTCRVRDHWELVAQYLAGAPLAGNGRGPQQAVVRQVKETGIAHAVSLGTTLAVSVHPLGIAAGLGTRLVESRLHAGRDQADALHRLGQDLRALRAQADAELAGRGAGKPS